MEYTLDKHPAPEARDAVRFLLSKKGPIGQLCRVLKLGKPRVAFFKRRGTVGMYISGTTDHPVILLNAAEHVKVEKAVWGVCWPDEIGKSIESTLVHELGHAYLESCGVWCGEYEHPEDKVEEATWQWMDSFRDGEGAKKILDRVVEKVLNLPG